MAEIKYPQFTFNYPYVTINQWIKRKLIKKLKTALKISDLKKFVIWQNYSDLVIEVEQEVIQFL